MEFTINRAEKKEPSNIIDGGKSLIRCSSCNAPLVYVWSTYPNIDIKFKIKADCPHCGDKSFIKEIIGLFHLGIGYLQKDSNPDHDIVYTEIEDTIIDDDLILIKTKKVNEWVQ